jgi:hypothetical protein
MLRPALAANARDDAERLYILKCRRSDLILKVHDAIGECETGILGRVILRGSCFGRMCV